MDGEDVVKEEETIHTRKENTRTLGIALGSVFGLLGAALIIVLVVLWRKGIILNKDKRKDPTKVSYPKDAEYVNVSSHRTCESITEAPYDSYNAQTDTTDELTMTPGTEYESICQSTQLIVREKSIVNLKEVNRGKIYNVFTAEPNNCTTLPRKFIVKKLKDQTQNNLLVTYLQEASQLMSKLDHCENIIKCLGIINEQDDVWLLMENASYGNLHQYLTAMMTDTYMNAKGDTRQMLKTFSQQIVNGWMAVSGCQPECLFYCLSCDHVLIGEDKVCKLTGFSSRAAIRNRENMDQEYGLPRPLRWLAPEAIRLQHSQKSDVWGLGMLLWELFSYGEKPFSTIADEDIEYHVLDGNHPAKPKECSYNIFDMMSKCWLYNEDSRPTAAEIRDVLLDEAIYENTAQ